MLILMVGIWTIWCYLTKVLGAPHAQLQPEGMLTRAARKRAMQQDNTSSSSSADPSCAGDKTACPATKRQACTSDVISPLCDIAPCFNGDAGGSGNSHNFTVFIQDWIRPGSNPEIAVKSQTGKRVEARIECHLGDKWEELPCHQRRHRLASTGDRQLDQLLDGFELAGYSIQRPLHRGHHGHILLVWHNLRKRYAVLKLLHKPWKGRDVSGADRGSEAMLWTVEVPPYMRLQHELSHPGVVAIQDTSLLGGRVCLLLEHCEAGPLEQLLNASPACLFSEGVARRYMYQLVDVLEWLHARDISHCDVSTAHLLIDQNDRLKLTDFSSAQREVGVQRVLISVGMTPGYRPPEVLQVALTTPQAVDMWQTGVVLYRMLSGRLPYPPPTRYVISDPPPGGGSDLMAAQPSSVMSAPSLTLSNYYHPMSQIAGMNHNTGQAHTAVNPSTLPTSMTAANSLLLPRTPRHRNQGPPLSGMGNDCLSNGSGISATAVLTEMQNGPNLPENAAVSLSTSAIQLLKGLLQSSPADRFTLARLRHSDWYRAGSTTTHIGNFYRVHCPRRITTSQQEADLKMQWQV